MTRERKLLKASGLMKAFALALVLVLGLVAFGTAAFMDTAFAETDIPDWVGPDDHVCRIGEMVYYVSDDGTTSGEVTEGMTWIQVRHREFATWFGLDNSKKILEEGSRFYVKWIDPNTKEFFDYLRTLEPKMKEELEDTRSSILIFGATDPAGREYGLLKEEISLYIELGDELNAGDVEAMFLSGKRDENIKMGIVREKFMGEYLHFAKMDLTHFDGDTPIGYGLQASIFGEYKWPFILGGAAVILIVIVIAKIAVAKRKRREDENI